MPPSSQLHEMPTEEYVRPVERRASVRRLCNRDILSRKAGTPRGTGWLAAVRDVSTTGIGMMLYCKFAPGTILAVEPLSRSSTRTLLARVVRTTVEADGWYHGCELANALTDEELQGWL